MLYAKQKIEFSWKFSIFPRNGDPNTNRQTWSHDQFVPTENRFMETQKILDVGIPIKGINIMEKHFSLVTLCQLIIGLDIVSKTHFGGFTVGDMNIL